MSIGINDMQATWQKFNSANPGWNTMSSGSSVGSGVASLQTPSSLGGAQNSISASANIPGINAIEMPSWLSKNADSNMGELLKSYAGIGAAFDPTGQVNARNDAIAYNSSAGGQAANNAATEYSNRAAQSGASGLGAGVVKAQAMMPVLAQNAALKTDAADVAAKAHQEGATLAANIANTIGQLRTSYLSTLTGYATGQQQLALDRYKAEQSTALGAGQQALGYAQLQADQYKTNLAAQQQRDSEARLAAMGLLNSQSPTGMYQTNNQGQVTSGQSVYNAMQNWGSARNTAQNALLGML
jgi:hypothetical protein